MTRGDLVTVAAGADYAGKPRPAVIAQSDDYGETASLTVCLLTSRDVPEAPTLRVAVEPDADNRLERRSWIMVDKIQTIPKTKVGRRFGRISPMVAERLDRSLVLFLGLGRRPSGNPSADRAPSS